MLIVASNSLNRPPRFWDNTSDFYVPDVNAIMVNFADFMRAPELARGAKSKGLKEFLGVQSNVKVYLDNGSFYYSRKGLERPIKEYIEFVKETQPDWYPIPTDYIPYPYLSKSEQGYLFEKTMEMNIEYSHKGFVPVVHPGDWLMDYLELIDKYKIDIDKGVALGGLVPRLLQAKGSTSRITVINIIKKVKKYIKAELHAFGIGGLLTLHLAANLSVDSIDSAGWRNRAARGLIFIPGRGERGIVQLGNWSHTSISEEEWRLLEECRCPVCVKYGIEGLMRSNKRGNLDGIGNGGSGFKNRATHNLWTLQKEADLINEKISSGEYDTWFNTHVKPGTLSKVIKYAIDHRKNGGHSVNKNASEH